jgi:hypothetical protein
MNINLKKSEEILFYIFLFAIPISFRHIFGYQMFRYVEWQAMYVYITDILLLILFGFWLYSGARPKAARADWFLLAFIIAAGISVYNAIDTSVAWFTFIKLIEGALLYFYIKDYALKRFNMTSGFTALVLGGLFQSAVGVTQFMTQSSLGLKYFGESVLSPSMNNIAAFIVNGVKVIRAYGTTPHSNILAAYLFIAIGAFYNIAIYQKRQWWWHLFHAIILWAFFLTFSRVIVGLWALNFIIRSVLIRFYPRFRQKFWDKPEMRRRSLKVFYTTIAVVVLFTAVYWPYVTNRATISYNDEAVQMRVFYNNESLSSGRNLFGLGIGNFVPWLETQNLHLSYNLYQPVHNIYLLIYSETGIVGIGLFLIFIILLWYNFWQRLGFKKLYHFSFSLIIISICIFGLFDHFLWTIQAGRLMLWLALGLLAGAE